MVFSYLINIVTKPPTVASRQTEDVSYTPDGSEWWAESMCVWVGGVLRSLCHASAGLHLLQSFREVAVVRLQFVHLVQRRPQLSGQTKKENYLGHEGRQKYFKANSNTDISHRLYRKMCWRLTTASTLPPNGGLQDKSNLHCQKDLTHQIECFPSLLD